MRRFKVMKQKLRNLSAPANIIFAILAVFIFIALLQWSGKVLGLIPGMEKADDYLLQAIVETVVLVIFLGITYLFGLWDIFKENVAGLTRSLYTGGFFIVYCLYAVVSGIYMCFLSEHGDVKAFYNILFFFIAVCLVGLVEELVFRGVVFNLLLRAFPKTKGGITGAVVLGGVLFGLMHFSNMGAGVKFSSCLIQVISAGLMGVLFCMIYASTRNFWILAIFHTVVDMGGLLSSGIFEGGGVADSTNPIIDVIIPAVAIALLYCFALFDILEASMPTIPSPIRYPKNEKIILQIPSTSETTASLAPSLSSSMIVSLL